MEAAWRPLMPDSNGLQVSRHTARLCCSMLGSEQSLALSSTLRSHQRLRALSFSSQILLGLSRTANEPGSGFRAATD